MVQQPPVVKNEFYTCEVAAQGMEGEGICRIEGFTVFVPNAVEGDMVKIKVVKVNKAYAYGKLMEVVTPSPYRIPPACPHFARCGGCNLMHIDYQHQLALKKKQVTDALARIGGFQNSSVADTLGMEHPFGYRNKTQFPIGTGTDDKPIWGFFARRSHDIVPIDQCMVGSSHCTPALRAVAQYMKTYKVRAYDETTHKGVIRHVFIRSSDATGEVMVVVVTNAIHLPYPEMLVELIREAVPGVVGVIQNINRDKTNLVMSRHNVVLWGHGVISDVLDGLRFEISPNSFYQVNSKQTSVLYGEALKAAGLTGNEVVFDLYCGTGTISLFLAREAKEVIGIEIVEAAVEDAKKNAIANDINNAHFYAGAVEDVVVRLYEDGKRVDVVVLDPPRKGSDEVTLDLILEMRPLRIVYVSCNPATLARDLRHLADGGYEIKSVVPVDMFAQTMHVETVVLITRIENGVSEKA